ncbi:hypothetical protein AC578_4597 [Pseudocercospora eumusae]|uniref:Uncharacterized protein n=1 Tax=Pseudocercospora eumusae TaxID=321146 RepID=A0A139H4Y2_9PEZI|nr:hypothetical protein AC578_4597 [Pseudocercospora eumusae]
MSTSSDSGDSNRAQRRPRNYTRTQQFPHELRESGYGEQALRVRRDGTERKSTSGLPMHGPDSVLENARRLDRTERRDSERRYHTGSERRLRAADALYRPGAEFQERYFGGDGNRELTTSYIHEGYDYGALGDIYTVVGRPAPPQARRQMPYAPDSNGTYDTRAPDAGTAFRRVDAGAQEQQYRDTRSFDADVDLSMSSEQRGPSRQSSGFEGSSASGLRQTSASDYTGATYHRRSRRDSRTETYVSRDAWYCYHRSQDPERRE